MWRYFDNVPIWIHGHNQKYCWSVPRKVNTKLVIDKASTRWGPWSTTRDIFNIPCFECSKSLCGECGMICSKCRRQTICKDCRRETFKCESNSSECRNCHGYSCDKCWSLESCKHLIPSTRNAILIILLVFNEKSLQNKPTKYIKYKIIKYVVETELMLSYDRWWAFLTGDLDSMYWR